MVHRSEELYTGLCVYGSKRPEESCECQYTYLGEVIESDHAAITVEWKGVMVQHKKNKECLNKQKWEVFGRRINEKENMSEMNSTVAK